MVAKRRIYLDHSASTPTDPRVVDAMMPYFTEIYGNPSSGHSYGREAEYGIESARETISRILNCKPSEIIFTSGGSESDNLAVRGTAWSARKKGHGARLITSPVEHPAVSKTVEQLAIVMGFEQVMLPVNQYGLVNINAFHEACLDGATLASVMLANNEVGTIQPIENLAAIAREQKVLLHTDAVQAAGQVKLDVQVLGVDMLSLSAHKFYGPKGVGALYVREGIELVPSQSGGSHEENRRAGTHNTPFIVGMAKALELAYEEFDIRVQHYKVVRDQLIDGVMSRIPDVRLTGHPVNRLASHASFVFDGLESNTLMMHLDMRGLAVSAASACKTGNPEPSQVLLAMGFSPEEAMSSLRFTVGRQTTFDDIEYAVDILAETVERLRSLNHGMVL
jgi:cysteine desulfurase